jgi:tRNA dimethylallyltransferase
MPFVRMAEVLQPLVVIVGPTAVGKTEIAVRLSQDCEGVIISADSRQIYRQMDIGTAKPTVAELHAAPHELIGILDPDQELGVAQYQQKAYQAIDTAIKNGKLPFMVGGTGQFVTAVIEGWGIPEVPPQPLLRADLLPFADLYSSTALHDWLSQIDPPAASAIDFRNVRRVVRALEVFLVTGKPISVLQQRNPPPYRVMKIGFTRPRESLYDRADARIDSMINSGLIKEVEALVANGYTWGLPAMSSLGYPEVGAYLRGEISLEQAAAQMKQATRRFIRHQYNWFRLDDPEMRWFDLSTSSYQEIYDAVLHWLRE